MKQLVAEVAVEMANSGFEKDHYRIVIAGEFNSGKSSVINLLLRDRVVPASVDFTLMPPINIFPSDSASVTVTTLDGAEGDREAFLDGTITGEELANVRIERRMDAFEGAVISEVTVGLDGRLQPAAAALLHSADLLIWCTMGQRAWALTEIAIVEKLPASVLEKSILAVTRSDYLRNESKRELVYDRLTDQASKYFSKIIMLEAGRNDVQRSSDEAHWAATGGKELYDAVMVEFEAFKQAGARSETASAGAEIIDFVKPGSQPVIQSAADAAHRWSREVDTFADWVEENLDADVEAIFEAIQNHITKFAAVVSSGTWDDDGRRQTVQNMFGRGLAVLNQKAKKGVTEETARQGIDVLMQLEGELFAMIGGNHGV